MADKNSKVMRVPASVHAEAKRIALLEDRDMTTVLARALSLYAVRESLK